MSSLSIRSVFTPRAVFQLLLGWIGFFAVLIARPALQGALPTPMLFIVLAAIIAVIVVCAFGVVTQAERLAHRLGDPYGTLVLTLSIVVIEVILGWLGFQRFRSRAYCRLRYDHQRNLLFAFPHWRSTAPGQLKRCY